MIKDILDKLINLCIDLVVPFIRGRKKEDREENRRLFENHVQPIFEVFADLHKNYLESFRSYRELIRKISNYSAEVDMICDQISTDNLFTEDKRNRLASLYKTKHLKELEPFVFSIFSYLVGAIEGNLGSEFGDDIYEIINQHYLERGELPIIRTQYFRTSFIKDLQSLKDPSYRDNERKNEAISKLDEKVKLLQERRKDVDEAYAEIKKSLLKET